MEENISNNGSNSGLCRCGCSGVSFPPGYRFNPTDKELIENYLKKKIMNNPLPFEEFMQNKIVEIDIYQQITNPETLAEHYKLASGNTGEKDCYFFTPRDRRYPNGERPSRAAGIGYWKASGADKIISNDKVVFGYRKSLVFYIGKSPKGVKTNWLMHEYRYNGPARKRTCSGDMKLDDWVLCKIYKKPKSTKSKSKEEDTELAEVREEQLPDVSKLDENQINQGGRNGEVVDEKLIKMGEIVDMFMNRDIQQQLLPSNPCYDTQPPIQTASIAGNIPHMNNLPFPQFVYDQEYIPTNEMTHGFQQPPPVLPPPQMMQPVGFNHPLGKPGLISWDDFYPTQYSTDSMLLQQYQHYGEHQQHYSQQSYEEFCPVENNLPEIDEYLNHDSDLISQSNPLDGPYE